MEDWKKIEVTLDNYLKKKVYSICKYEEWGLSNYMLCINLHE